MIEEETYYKCVRSNKAKTVLAGKYYKVIEICEKPTFVRVINDLGMISKIFSNSLNFKDYNDYPSIYNKKIKSVQTGFTTTELSYLLDLVNYTIFQAKLNGTDIKLYDIKDELNLLYSQILHEEEK